MLNVGADVSDAEYCHNELDNKLLSAHIITGAGAKKGGWLCPKG